MTLIRRSKFNRNTVYKPTYLKAFLVFSALLLLNADFFISWMHNFFATWSNKYLRIHIQTDLFKVLVLRDSINGGTEI